METLLPGTSMEKGETSGKLIFFKKDTFEKAFEMEIGNSHVIKEQIPIQNQLTFISFPITLSLDTFVQMIHFDQKFRHF